MATTPTAPAHIERTLSLGILRGLFPAGTRLPTVRKLAARFRVNQATIQRVVARLETRGLIRARQGSGLAVTDPETALDLGLLPLLIEAVHDEPARAAHLLDGVLEVRRVIASRLLVRNRARLLEHIGAAADAGAAVVRAAREGADAFRAADLAFARRILVLSDSPIALYLFNTIAKVLDEVPLVAQAMYAEPDRNLASMMRVMTALREASNEELGAIVETAMAEVDRATVARFEQLLNARPRKAR